MDRQYKIRAAAIVFVTILAALLGGSTALWAKSVIAIAVGALFIVLPPRRSLPALDVIFLAILAVALLAFLPTAIFGSPAWRTDLSNLGVKFPATLSPQPWLTFESTCLLALGLAWTLYLFGCNLDLDQRQKALTWFCIGVLGLAAILIGASLLHQRVPWWPPEIAGYGFFPNRNQTGNVLGIAGVMIYANAMHGWQRGHRLWWIWILAICLIIWALITNGSRAGVILFFVGAFVWHLWWIGSSSEKRLPSVLLIALVLFGGLLIWSGPSLIARFIGPSSDLWSRNGRFSIYHDAWNFFTQSPFAGIGLGNFRSLFSAQRHYFISAAEAIHPESDWLWILVEMGGLAPLLLLAAAGVWMRAFLPLNPGTLRATRVAAMICGCLFIIHGLVDVSGHRIGAIWPALFLGSIAINPGARSSAARPIVFRFAGVFFIVIGGFWLASIFGWPAPTSVAADRFAEKAELENSVGDYSGAISLSEQGLAIAPLNWKLYYQRGLAAAALHHPRPTIEQNFAVARYLMPNRPDVALQEGLVWLSVGDEDRAFSVWKESMQRWPDNAALLYSGIFGSVHDNAELRDRWRQLGHVDPRCLPILLQNVTRLEFNIELTRLLSDDPELRSLPPAEKKILFATWLREGDQLSLADALQRHPEWQTIGWSELTTALANNGDYHPAYETAIRFMQPPRLPNITANDFPQTLAIKFRATGDVANDGIALVISRIKANDLDGALDNLKAFSGTAKPPPAVYFLEGQIWAQKSQWQKAWDAMMKYRNAVQREP